MMNFASYCQGTISKTWGSLENSYKDSPPIFSLWLYRWHHSLAGLYAFQKHQPCYQHLAMKAPNALLEDNGHETSLGGWQSDSFCIQRIRAVKLSDVLRPNKEETWYGKLENAALLRAPIGLQTLLKGKILPLSSLSLCVPLTRWLDLCLLLSCLSLTSLASYLESGVP